MKVITGPMGSSKTSTLLKEILWARNGLNQSVRVFKPSIDTRSESELVSHDGLRSSAESVRELPDAYDADLIVLDEVQFVPMSCVEWAKDHLDRGINMIVGGLDMDWRGDAFLVTATFLAMADIVVKQTSHCAVCGHVSTHTAKLYGSDDSIEIGGLG